MYIYKIENKINGKIYIGQSTKNPNNNKNYYGSGKLIKLAIKKYGIENFEKTIILECHTKQELDTYEKVYIEKYNSTENGYNISTGGNGGDLGSIVNLAISNKVKDSWKCGKYAHINWKDIPRLPHSDETKEKIKLAQSGELGYWYGKKFTDCHRKKIKIKTNIAYNLFARENLLISMRKKETREKISNSLKGNVPWNAGRKNVYTEQQLLKMSESAKKRKINETNEKIRREKISNFFSKNHPSKKKILDVSDGCIYDSIRDFCNKTNISWYRTKLMRKQGLLKEI